MIDCKAGLVVTLGTLIYAACAVGILLYHRPQMFNDLIAFASQYEVLEKRVLEDLAPSLCRYGYGRQDDLVQ